MISAHTKNKQPFLSIIIASLNDENTIEDCLKSIVQQTVFGKIEILVKDGKSADQTTEILKKYNNSISFWESSHDSGIYDAWNSVIAKAKGQWILFLGADDSLFDRSVVEDVIAILGNSASDVDLAYGNVRLVTSDKKKILDTGKDWSMTQKCINEKMCMPHQGILHNRSLFKKYGIFSTDYFISSDYEFLKRVLKTSKVLYLNMLIACMGMEGVSSNPNNTFKRLNEIRKINKLYGKILPGKRWIITYTNASFRYILFTIAGEIKAKVILDYLRKIAGLPPFWTKI